MQAGTHLLRTMQARNHDLTAVLRVLRSQSLVKADTSAGWRVLFALYAATQAMLRVATLCGLVLAIQNRVDPHGAGLHGHGVLLQLTA